MKITQNGKKIHIYKEVPILVPRPNKPPVEQKGHQLILKLTLAEYDELKEAMHEFGLDRWNSEVKKLFNSKK